MSIEATAWAMTRDLPMAERFALILLADGADHMNECDFPTGLASRMGTTPDIADAALRALQASGYLQPASAERPGGFRLAVPAVDATAAPPRLSPTGTLYVVGWRNHGIMKVGVTRQGSKRWQSFVETGAEVLSIRESHAVAAVERAVLDRMRALYPPAFKDARQAAEVLARAGGFTECFTVPLDQWERALDMIEGVST